MLPHVPEQMVRPTEQKQRAIFGARATTVRVLQLAFNTRVASCESYVPRRKFPTALAEPLRHGRFSTTELQVDRSQLFPDTDSQKGARSFSRIRSERRATQTSLLNRRLFRRLYHTPFQTKAVTVSNTEHSLTISSLYLTF